MTVLKGTAGMPTERMGTGNHMFFFFSNRLGCFGSLVLSAIVTVLLILLLNR